MSNAELEAEGALMRAGQAGGEDRSWADAMEEEEAVPGFRGWPAVLAERPPASHAPDAAGGAAAAEVEAERRGKVQALYRGFLLAPRDSCGGVDGARGAADSPLSHLMDSPPAKGGAGGGGSEAGARGHAAHGERAAPSGRGHGAGSQAHSGSAAEAAGGPDVIELLARAAQQPNLLALGAAPLAAGLLAGRAPGQDARPELPEHPMGCVRPPACRYTATAM
jgi:hypothetical protein